MNNIKIYVLSEDGSLSHTRTGNEDNIKVSADKCNERYTITPPPDYDHQWRWIDSKWTTDDTAN